jgi:hypothetical protein
MRGRVAATLVAASFAALAAPSALAVPAPPKVTIIVGPVGPTITDSYRADADAAAAVALTLTPNVVKVYSPDATWPAVRAAVTGAAVVIYLGHGNGWPSRYSDALMPRTQDGFGLNPVAGVDDRAHQYYGEAFVAKLHLAPGAVVLLHHLCYASGHQEPGMAEGTFDQVLGRVDNFAAGFLAAGASTVIAEGHANPASLVAAALNGGRAVAAAWTGASWGHRHTTSYASTRTPGATISLDPDTIGPDGTGAGYYRSIVQVAGVPASPRVVTPVPVVPPGPPSLASTGARFGAAKIAGSILPGQVGSLRIPVTRAARSLPAALTVGVRWVALVQPGASAGGASTDEGLVVGEAASDVVGTAEATVKGNALAVRATIPAEPGTYVVLLTLETGDGVPYDVATQALLRPFTVVVPKPIDVRITAPAGLNATAGTATILTVGIANTGTQAWGSELLAPLWADPALEPWLATYLDGVLALDATWVDPETGAATPAATYALPRALGVPGHTASVQLAVRAPDEPGHDLLVLAVAARGSLGDFPTDSLVIPVVVR